MFALYRLLWNKTRWISPVSTYYLYTYMYRLVHFFLHSVISNYLIEMRMMMTMMVIIVIILCNLSRWEFYAYKSFQWRCQTDYHCMNKIAFSTQMERLHCICHGGLQSHQARLNWILAEPSLNKENRAPVNIVLGSPVRRGATLRRLRWLRAGSATEHERSVCHCSRSS